MTLAHAVAPVEAAADVAYVEPEEPRVHPTLPWFLTQLVPSPELAGGRQAGVRFGLRWQVTPLLYSWGVHRGLSPWRFFVAEPYVRQSGSVELYVTPEYFPGYGASFGKGWMARAGARTYLPLVSHGEYLSTSVGASYFYFGGRSGAAYEVGATSSPAWSACRSPRALRRGPSRGSRPCACATSDPPRARRSRPRPG